MADQPIPTNDPSRAQAVQIPLQSFTVPTFPPEALAAPIQALTLTSDINLSEYQDLLSMPFETIPELPASIESLTLELFTLGYPVGFLTQLAARLPRLKGLTVFGQLIGGVEDSQGTDAEGFFESIGRAGGLREVHFIDAFGKAGFWERVGGYLNPKLPKATESGELDRKEKNEEGGLNLLEISYTYRHSDEEFLTRIHAADLLALVQPSLVAASFNISPPPPKADDADERVEREDPENLDPEGKMLEKRPEGVMVLHPTHTSRLMETVVEKWGGEQAGLRMLALTLFTLSVGQVGDVLGRHRGLRVLNVTVGVDKVEGWRGQLLDVLGKGEELEVVEVVVSPGLDFYLQATNPKALTTTLDKIFPSKENMITLSGTCKNLRSFEMNILRTTSFGKAEWERDAPDAEWKGQISKPEGEVPAKPDGVPEEIKEHYEGKIKGVAKEDGAGGGDGAVATAPP